MTVRLGTLKQTKEKPIIFSTEMVKAILAGKKSMTRRVVKYNWQPGDGLKGCPYEIGMRLWVRETFACFGLKEKSIHYVASHGKLGGGVMKPSIFMPRWASRITLEVTGLKVERVQDISPDDAVAEGIPFKCGYYCDSHVGHVDHYGQVNEFRKLWDSINAKRGYGWSQNPYVWVVSFKREQSDR